MPVSSFKNLKRGGSYSRWVVKKRQQLRAGAQGIVALPIVHDWGPFKEFTRVGSLAEFNEIYGEGVGGSDNPTPGWLAAYNAFKGENSDEPGAGELLVYRTGAASAAKATKVLNNTAAAAAITLTAKYEGTRGNNLDVLVEANATNPGTQNDLVVLEDGVVYERWTHTKADIQGLADAINDRSDWLTAGNVTNGTALATIASTSLAGGNDGTALTAGDWTNVQTAYETQQWEVFVPFDLTDGSIITSIAAWTAVSNTPNSGSGKKPKRFTSVVGGALDESFATAFARTQGIDNENVVNVGIGSVRDTALDRVLSTSQLAPRIAGIIAHRGFDAAIDFAHLADLEIVVGPSDADIVAAIDPDPGRGGIVVLGTDSGGVRVEKGVTTRISDTDDRPKETFGRIKHVFTMQSFERRLQERHEASGYLGKADVNNDTREYLVSDATTLLDEYIQAGAMQRGATVGLAVDPPPSDDDTFIALDYHAKFGQSLEAVHNTFYMG